MSGLLWILVLIGVIMGLVALWRTNALSRELKRLKRNEYYVDMTLRSVGKQIMDAVEPLRVQLATVASGLPVGQDLIRSGMLYREVSVEEAHRLIEKGTSSQEEHFVIIDVRTPKEYAVKHVPGATLMPVEELETRFMQEIPPTIDKVFVYCASGDRSRLACDFLSRHGFTNLYLVRDGIQQWPGLLEGEGKVSLIEIQKQPVRRN